MNSTSTISLSLLVLISTVAAQNGAQKTTLEDIERDYTTSKPKQTTAKVVAPAQSPTLYGFVPIKTIADYTRNEPKPLLYSQGRQQYSPYGKQQYHQQSQHHRGSGAGTKTGTTQAYTFPLQFDLLYYSPQKHLQTVTQYFNEKQHPIIQHDSATQKCITPDQQYAAAQGNYSQENAYTFPLQFDLPYSSPQQHSQTGTQYQQQQYSTTQQYPATQQYTTSRQQYTVPQGGSYNKNVQYVTDNSLAVQQYPRNVQYVADNNIGNQQQQQYYSPQYVYLQQDPAPSTSVQTFIDPKGGVQYIMLIPQPAITTTNEQPQKYENLAYASVDGESYSQKYAQVSYNNQKEQEVPTGQQYVYQYEQKEEKAPAAGVQYVVQPQYEQKEQQQVQYVHPKPQYTKPSEYIIKREPKSLLDSYIPSVVQLEYYRQIQQNAIRDNVKVPQVFHKRQELSSQSSTTDDATPDVSRQYVTKYVPQSSTKRYAYRG
nr:unnamed protein product [Callosobruchus analis]